MRSSHVWVIVWVIVCLVVVALSDDTTGSQGTAAGVPTLPYKPVDWPMPATSVAGFPAPWNLIQA